VRRTAIALLVSSSLLLAAAAQAGTEYTIQIHNNSSQTVDVIVFQKDPNYFRRAEKIRHHVAPGDFLVSDGIKPDSCVVIRVAHDNGDDDARCKDNRTPVDLRCDVSDRYLCKVHAGEVKDLVVTVSHPD
jgi:hypothetical protein